MRWMSLFLLVAAAGCGSVKMNPEPVNVSGSVTVGGQPVSNVILQFQPTGDGLPAPVPVADGKFTASILPGQYAYFIGEGTDLKAYEAVPAEFRAATLDRQITVSSSTSSLDIAF